MTDSQHAGAPLRKHIDDILRALEGYRARAEYYLADLPPEITLTPLRSLPAERFFGGLDGTSPTSL